MWPTVLLITIPAPIGWINVLLFNAEYGSYRIQLILLFHNVIVILGNDCNCLHFLNLHSQLHNENCASENQAKTISFDDPDQAQDWPSRPWLNRVSRISNLVQLAGNRFIWTNRVQQSMGKAYLKKQQLTLMVVHSVILKFSDNTFHNILASSNRWKLALVMSVSHFIVNTQSQCLTRKAVQHL